MGFVNWVEPYVYLARLLCKIQRFSSAFSCCIIVLEKTFELANKKKQEKNEEYLLQIGKTLAVILQQYIDLSIFDPLKIPGSCFFFLLFFIEHSSCFRNTPLLPNFVFDNADRCLAWRNFSSHAGQPLKIEEKVSYKIFGLQQ